jgi:hypothetical protein
MNWQNAGTYTAVPFTCGFCDREVASVIGFFAVERGHGGRNIVTGNIRICPRCDQPTYFHGKQQVPDVAPGRAVSGAPEDVHGLYEEARRCVAASAPTSAVLTCRKLLMNIAVSQGAAEGESFLSYVSYLADKGYVPPNGKHWVDHIRKKGNEANHEIALMDKGNAIELLEFCEMLLKFVFEFPNRVPKPAA